MAQTVDTMSTVGSSDLRDAFETGVEALVSLGQQAPKDLVAEYEQLLGAYRVIEMELSASNWLSSDYLASSHSAKQLALLTSEDTNIAVEVITTDAANHCKLDLSFSAESTDTVVTLPQPPTPDDSTLDRPVSLEEGDSSTIAMGMFVAERYSLAITNPQALCVGDKFMLMPEQGDLDEKGLDELYRSLLTDCGVVLPQS